MVTTRGLKVDYTQPAVKGLGVGKPSAKRRRTKGKGKGRAVSEGIRIAFDLFMQLPMDIFAEICSYLQPLDLHNLSLVAPRFREILTSDESKHIWKVAKRRYEGIPDCPSDLTEPQYARFLFATQECHGCETTNGAPYANYFYRLRYCQTCQSTKFMSYTQARKRFKGLSDEVVSYAAPTNVNKKMHRYYLNGHTLHPATIETLHSEFIALPTGDDDTAVAQRQSWHDAWSARCTSARKTGEEIRQWTYLDAQRETAKKNARINARAAALKENIFAMGEWTELDIPYWTEPYQSLLKQPHDWAPEEWKKNKSKIMKLVAAHHEQRLVRERLTRQNNRRWRLQNHYRSVLIQCIGGTAPFFRAQEATCPTVEKFFALPEVETLYEDDTQDVTQEAWDNVAGSVRAFAIGRREGILRRLTTILKGEVLDALPEAFEDRIAQVSIMATELLHASSAFWCSCCNTVKWYPDVLQHTQNFDVLSRLPESCAGLMDTLVTEMRQATATGEEDEQLATFTVMDLMKADQIGARWRCLRCDDRVVTYRTFSDLICHFVKERMWLTSAQSAISTDRKGSYPHIRARRKLPTLHDAHDWTEDKPLSRQDDSVKRGLLSKLQKRFKRNRIDHHEADELTEDGELPTRVCLLCPKGFSPSPVIGAARMEVHIELRHRKEPEVKTDAVVVAKDSPSVPHHPDPSP